LLPEFDLPVCEIRPADQPYLSRHYEGKAYGRLVVLGHSHTAMLFLVDKFQEQAFVSWGMWERHRESRKRVSFKYRII